SARSSANRGQASQAGDLPFGQLPFNVGDGPQDVGKHLLKLALRWDHGQVLTLSAPPATWQVRACWRAGGRDRISDFLGARNSFRQIADNGPLLRNKFRAPICHCEWPPKNLRSPSRSM